MARNTRYCRPVTGSRGAVSAGHPLAASAATETLACGGNAVDAAIAAQAVICVVMPQAAGIGGDMLALIHHHGQTSAIGGTGLSPALEPTAYTSDGGASVTTPGIVDGWITASATLGGLPLAVVLEPAIRLAEEGFPVDAELVAAVEAQRARISRYGADEWSLLQQVEGQRWAQPELAVLLERIATEGRGAFYAGAGAHATTQAIARHGGTLTVEDLARHRTLTGSPVQVAWAGGRLSTQPAPTQGVLLAMAAGWIEGATGLTAENLEHALIEATEAAFMHRDAAGRGTELLEVPLRVDLEHAQHRGGPRAYLHTAGVAVADADGMVVSSLVSVFDDFGSGVFVPELGIVLNNRAGGFTSGANAPGPERRPVHTLAPALVELPNGDVLALATPGADGQVQTLLQVIERMRFGAEPLDAAIAAPRWRSQDGRLLVESDHPAIDDLRRRGHIIETRVPGDDLFGAVVAAGTRSGQPFAASDWRRQTTTGAV